MLGGSTGARCRPFGHPDWPRRAVAVCDPGRRILLGHLVAQVPDDESAEALLERIAADGVSSKKHKPVRARKPRTLRPSSGDKKEQKKRRIGLQLMWNEGHSMAEIAATMEITTAKLGNEMTRMRKEGWDLPYRRRTATA